MIRREQNGVPALDIIPVSARRCPHQKIVRNLIDSLRKIFDLYGWIADK